MSPSSPIVLASSTLNRSGDRLSVELHRPADSSQLRHGGLASETLDHRNPHPKRSQHWRR